MDLTFRQQCRCLSGDAGLALRGKNGGVYDRFRNRLMFPIIDIRNNIIGFGGRVMDDSTPKYLNSPETIIFNKRKNLFALNIARKSKQGRGRCNLQDDGRVWSDA